jgi:uncharacterized membrane protein YhaH (DUF805 family)
MSSQLPEPTIGWLYLSWTGRIGRQSYFLGAALMLVVQFYILLEVAEAGQNNSSRNIMAAWGFLLIGYWIASCWAILALTIKRIHDLGLRPIWAICLFVPMFAMLFVLYMMIKPGSQETNEHGPPPFPKS